jgi:excisionase family DNA binding protein
MPKDSRKWLNNSTTLSKKDLVTNEWVSQSEAARIRGVSPQAIGRLIHKGRFRTLRIGGKVLLNRREVENYKPKRTGRPRK